MDREQLAKRTNGLAEQVIDHQLHDDDAEYTFNEKLLKVLVIAVAVLAAKEAAGGLMDRIIKRQRDNTES